jgi:hypothetical protein
MRGGDERSEGMFSYVRPEQRVPQDHPLRSIREIVDRALEALSPQFARLYSLTGRPSIPPEKLLRALLLQAFYTVRSERQLMEQLEYNLLFRWFVGLSMDAPVWDPSVFAKNRERLIDGGRAQPGAGSRPSLARALLGRWHADRSLGLDEELPSEGWVGRPADGWRPQRRARLPRREAHQ